MKRLKPWIGLLALAALGCTQAPGAPRTGFVLPQSGETPADQVVAAEAEAEGFGLQALGTNDFIVKLKPSGKQKGKKPRKGVKKRDMLEGSEIYTAQTEAEVREMMQEMGNDPDVEFCEPDYPVSLELAVNDPSYGLQWHLPKINMPTAWDTTLGNAGVPIAVIDSGIDMDHADLVSKIAATSKDFYDGDMNPNDLGGHGTHVSGIAAGATNNAIGIAGVAPSCPVMALRVGNTSFPQSMTIDAITYAVANGAKVINMSLGSYTESAAFRAAVDKAVGAGVVVVCSAGNDNTTKLHYPSDYEGAISVGASTSTDTKASFSNYGARVEIAAPGQGIYATTYDGAYGTMSGTSMAAPVVSGAAALLRGLRPTWTVEQINKAMMTTGAAVSGFTGSIGIKRINVQAALAAAMPVDSPATFTAITCTPSINGATLKWSASEPVTPSITISTVSTLAGGTTSSDPNFTTRPGTFSLSGLAPGTTYYYRVSGTDPKGNVTNSAIMSFTTTPIKLTGFAATLSHYQPILSFTASTPVTAEVLVGTAPGALVSKVGPTADLDTAHKHALVGLKPGTIYYYQVKTWDQFGYLTTSPVQTFKTSPLMITTMTAASTPYEAGFSWVTTAPTTGTISYGLTSAALSTTTPATATVGTSHHLDLAGLVPGTSYYYKINATDPDGNLASSQVLTFKTKPLEVKEAAASSRTPTTARATWITNVLATSELWKGPTSTALALAASDATPKRTHDLSLSGLTPNTTYYFKVKGVDATGRTFESQVFSVRTLP